MDASSPFPGMNPYLEQPSLWGGVHSRLIAIMGELLASQLPGQFFVDSEDNVYIIDPPDPGHRLIRPDLYLTETDIEVAPARQQESRGPIATPKRISALSIESITLRYATLIVRDARDHQVVTTIELLSPINKVPQSSGQQEFVRKRARVLQSTSHWIEIDLLRAGAQQLAVMGILGDYYAMLRRVGVADGMVDVWSVNLPQRLPTIAVPLRDPFPDVPLDLQEAVETLYTRYRYGNVIDYSVPPPPPPLSANDAAWCAGQIEEWRRTVARNGDR